ncbi:MAG TPA: dTDP-glucose 4,6-dehydratase [Bryobacteraceae bacterium]|nr:dTDP-glucose 4,6-dehydratase [Bryobacteraceae bacterium]
MNLLVTGGAGFIGSAFVRLVLATQPGSRVVNLDNLTYAGNLENLASISSHKDYRFVRGDIADQPLVESLLAEEKIDAVVHFAAESHVDRSILSSKPFFETNVLGTLSLLDAARKSKLARFVHVSTDEVYGDIEAPAEADEQFPLRASSPYSASKAGSDLLALSYVRTFGMDLSVTRASNNYGPYQFPEKLIPLMISNALDEKPLPVYGDGQQIRDWLYVDDHCRGIWAVLEKGAAGEVYNIGGNCSLPNLEVVQRILALTGRSASLITTVADRPGHDRRYALASAKMERELGWTPQMDFESGLRLTIDWYRANSEWVRSIKSGAYREYYEQNYGGR